MTCRLATSGTAILLMLASAGMVSGQVAVPAGRLVYRNTTGVPVVLQASVVLPNKQVRHGRAHLMTPLEVAWDVVQGAGVKIITIYDPKTRKPVCQQRINFVGRDLFFLIQLDPRVKGRARLVPVPDPRTMPGVFPGIGNGVMPQIKPGARPIVVLPRRR